MNFLPAIKGLITVALMIIVSLITFYTVSDYQSPLHYIVFGIYAAGIIWALIAHKMLTGDNRFWNLFNAGFRCFVTALLVMVVYTFVFNKMHPEFAERSSVAFRQDMIEKENEKPVDQRDKTPDQINEAVKSYKKGYAMAVVYGSIFTYLIVGVVVTAITSVILSQRK